MPTRAMPARPARAMPADRQRQQLGPTGPDLDLGAHRRAGAAFEARGPAAVLYLLGPRRDDRREPLLSQPVPVEPGVEVVPGLHLRVAALTRGVPGQVHAIVGQSLGGAAFPAVIREVLAPPVEARTVGPRRPDHLRDPAVSARQQPLDDRRLAVVVPEPDRLAVAAVRSQSAAERPEARVHGLVVALGRPLERGVRL